MCRIVQLNNETKKFEFVMDFFAGLDPNRPCCLCFRIRKDGGKSKAYFDPDSRTMSEKAEGRKLGYDHHRPEIPKKASARVRRKDPPKGTRNPELVQGRGPFAVLEIDSSQRWPIVYTRPMPRPKPNSLRGDQHQARYRSHRRPTVSGATDWGRRLYAGL